MINEIFVKLEYQSLCYFLFSVWNGEISNFIKFPNVNEKEGLMTDLKLSNRLKVKVTTCKCLFLIYFCGIPFFQSSKCETGPQALWQMSLPLFPFLSLLFFPVLRWHGLKERSDLDQGWGINWSSSLTASSRWSLRHNSRKFTRVYFGTWNQTPRRVFFVFLFFTSLTSFYRTE